MARQCSRISVWTLLLTLGAVVIYGCGAGNDGPTRHSLTGTITYNGQPVPAGEVALEPDTSQGNSGPAVIAPIKDGRFETAAGMGTVGGPHLVRIIGMDGQPYEMAGGMLMEDGQQLFAPYETTVDLPRQASSVDFEVPADHE